MNSISLKGSGYALSIHNNEPSRDPKVGEGQNGIRCWKAKDAPHLSPIALSWLNLEHVVTQDQQFFGNRKDPGFFEPRQYPIQLTKADNCIRLSHDPLPRTGCSCWIEYTPGNRANSLDFQIGFTPTQKVGSGNSIGLFLPCYIYQPENKSVHFIGCSQSNRKKRWIEYCSSCHRSAINFASHTTQHPPTYESTNFQQVLEIARYCYPFFTGQVGNYTLILMLDGGSDLEVRFWMSPEGGGWNPETHLTNPAWDFVILRIGYDINREYTARGRLIFGPLKTKLEAIKEYEVWSGQKVIWDDNSL